MAQLLYRRHDPASRTRYQDLKQLARSQTRVLAGTPGTLKQRARRYWVREYIRADGRKVDEYLGTEAPLDAVRAEIELAKALAAGSSTLRVFGYQRIERKPAAVLAALFNRGLGRAGLALVGSHAYGALLNDLGVIAPGYRTQDLDVARAQPLALALPEGTTFRDILNESGMEFVAVPGMPSHRPSASFKLPVKELGAHAQAIPLLDFLIEEPVDAVVLSPNQVIPVRVPAPERFALHKLFSSQSRKSDRDKVRKDLEQAAVIAAALEEDAPGALVDAFKSMPAVGKAAARRGARAAAKLLHGAHAEAEETLAAIAGK